MTHMHITDLTRETIGLSPTHVDEVGGITLASYWPLIEEIHKAVGGGDVVEIGSDRGFVTQLLRDRCIAQDCVLHAVDPAPTRDIALPGMTHHALRSREFLEGNPVPANLWIVDGDHNYETVLHEVSSIARLTEGRRSAMVLHDVSWPWARRDLWYNPAEAPRDGSVRLDGTSIAMDTDGCQPNGIPLGTITAIRGQQGGPRNGVLTAVEDFMDAKPGWTFNRTPLLFGFGLLVRTTDYESSEFATVRSWMQAFSVTAPVLASAEANRLRLLQTVHEHWTRADRAEARLGQLDRRVTRLALGANRLIDLLRGRKPANPAK